MATIGDGATYQVWTDCYPYTVIAVSKSGKRLTLQRDKSLRTDSNGMSECQSYTYERDPAGEPSRYRSATSRGARRSTKWLVTHRTSPAAS